MEQGTLKYRIIGAVVLLALAAILIPVLMDLRDDEPAPAMRQIELPDEPDDGMAGRVGPDGRTPPGALPELSDIPPPPAAEPRAELEPIPPAPPPRLPEQSVAPEPSVPQASSTPRPAPEGEASEPPPPAASEPEPAEQAEPAPREAQPPTEAQVGVESYVAQMGAFSNADSARGVYDRLKKAGFKVFTEETEVNGKAIVRVRVGPELQRAAAEQSCERAARELGLTDCKVQRYQ